MNIPVPETSALGYFAVSDDNEYLSWKKKLADNAIVVGPMSGP